MSDREREKQNNYSMKTHSANIVESQIGESIEMQCNNNNDKTTTTAAMKTTTTTTTTSSSECNVEKKRIRENNIETT